MGGAAHDQPLSLLFAVPEGNRLVPSLSCDCLRAPLSLQAWRA